jgi:hypothetical protein
MSALFLPEAEVVINYVNAGTTERIGVLNGSDSIGNAVATMMNPHPPMGWSHHTTHDHLIEVDGDTATIDAQFVVFNTRGAARRAGGWPPGVLGLQGTVTPIEAGYYRTVLRRVDGRWLILRHQIDHDLPMALPG